MAETVQATLSDILSNSLQVQISQVMAATTVLECQKGVLDSQNEDIRT